MARFKVLALSTSSKKREKEVGDPDLPDNNHRPSAPPAAASRLTIARRPVRLPQKLFLLTTGTVVAYEVNLFWLLRIV